MTHEEFFRLHAESHPFYHTSPEFRSLCDEVAERMRRQDEYERQQKARAFNAMKRGGS